MSRFFYSFSLCLVFHFFSAAYGQVIPIGSVAENQLRGWQLNGRIDSNLSFCARPFSLVSLGGSDSIAKDLGYNTNLSFLKGKGKLVPLPVSFVQQVNTHHPFGWNDGAMIPANGYQTLVTAGIYASLGPLEVQLQPEFVFASNTDYRSSALYGTTGNKSYQKFFAGQSDVRLSAFNLSVGVSTANLWWGPGRFSSLLMSNNAPGFLHGYFRTQKPIKSPVGSFEWQLIGGKLSTDGDLPFENRNLQPSTLSHADRYLSAFVFSYQPRWVPGLFLGMTRGLQRYTNEIDRSGSGFFEKYIPVLFKAVAKENARFDDTMGTDQLASFFLRWAFLKAKAEFYVEWGYNDYGYNTRDYLLGPSHSAAYLVGFKKLIPRTANRWIEFGIELTQMSQSPDWLVRDAGNWYVHAQVHEGYTNQNQILGAAAGLGCNVVSVDLAWINGSRRLGFLLERINRDPQYHSTKWVDIGLGVLPQWQYKQFVFSGKFELVKSRDYMWEPANTVFNMHSRFIVQYNF